MNSSFAKSLLFAHGFMLVTMLLVASSFPVGAAITNELDPAVMMFIRFSLATAFFAPYVFIKNGLAFPPKKQLFRYVVLSVPLVIFFWCMFESLRFTSALNTGALYTSLPAITAVYALFINHLEGRGEKKKNYKKYHKKKVDFDMEDAILIVRGETVKIRVAWVNGKIS